MSHYAKVQNGIVVDVIVAEQDVIDSGLFGNPADWVQTSYNKNIRKNYASIGGRYDRLRDAFIPACQYPSWTLDETTCQWVAPTAMPQDGSIYSWDEITKSWFKIAESEMK